MPVKRNTERPLMEWLKIASELKAVWDAQQPGSELESVTDALRVLKAHAVTIEELLALAESVGPLLALLQRER